MADVEPCEITVFHYPHHWVFKAKDGRGATFFCKGVDMNKHRDNREKREAAAHTVSSSLRVTPMIFAALGTALGLEPNQIDHVWREIKQDPIPPTPGMIVKAVRAKAFALGYLKEEN